MERPTLRPNVRIEARFDAAELHLWWQGRREAYERSTELFRQVVVLRESRQRHAAQRPVTRSSPITAPPATAVEVSTEGDPWAPLSAREREVASLVTHGKTNHQIANALVLTEGTVANHVRRILQRLGFESRARLAAWVAEDAQRRADAVAYDPRSALCTTARFIRPQSR
jgi:DNA-binding CsgD family transcriptional regulator